MNVELAAKEKINIDFLDTLALLSYPSIYTDVERFTKGTSSGLEDTMTLATKLGIKTGWVALNTNVLKDYHSTSAIQKALSNIATILPKKLTKLERDFDAQDIALIKAWCIFTSKRSDSAQRTLLDKIGKCCSDKVAKLFISNPEEDSLKNASLLEQRIALSKKLIGSTRKLTTDEIKKAKSSKSESKLRDINSYVRIMKESKDLSRKIINNISRSKGRLPTKEFIKYLVKYNLDVNIPADFEGLIDEKGCYTIYGELLDAVPAGQVKMNPNYKKGSSTYVLKATILGAKQPRNIYTKESIANSNKEKFEKVNYAIKELSNTRNKWRRDMYSNDDKKSQDAILVELSYLFASRIGSKGNETNGETTFGLSTIQARHVTVNTGGIVIKYKGKKGVPQRHEIKKASTIGDDTKSNIFLYNFFKDRKADCSGYPNEQIFSRSAANVNAYLKTILPSNSPITIHKFRTMRGTILMDALLNNKEWGSSIDPKKFNAYVVSCATEVGDLLGHTVTKESGQSKTPYTTALKNYIDPILVNDYYNKYEVRPTDTIGKIIS